MLNCYANKHLLLKGCILYVATHYTLYSDILKMAQHIRSLFKGIIHIIN